MSALMARAILPPMPSDRTLSRFSMSLPAGVLRTVGKLNVPLYRASRGRLFGT
jgi:hypothetical protein